MVSVYGVGRLILFGDEQTREERYATSIRDEASEEVTADGRRVADQRHRSSVTAIFE